MKKIAVLVTVIITLLCSFTLGGCNYENQTSENCYIVSIYKENYSQKNNGKVVFDGYSLKKSCQILKTQMLEIDDYEAFEIDGKTIVGKYYYNNLPGSYKIINNEKIQCFPSDNCRIFVRERESKTISIFYNGKEISTLLDEEQQEAYRKHFKHTYNEYFSISSKLLEKIFKGIENNFTIELYTTKTFSDEPFCRSQISFRNSSIYYGNCEFTLIQSTNVYIKVLDTNE